MRDKSLVKYLLNAVLFLFVADLYAATSVTSTATVGLNSVLSVEFDTVNSTMSSNINWANVDASQVDISPDGHLTTKPDIGLILKNSHITQGWYIQMSILDDPAYPGLAGKIRRYIGLKPNLRDAGGTLGNGSLNLQGIWTAIPTSGGTVYTSGSNDSNNISKNGSFLGINIGLRPLGLGSGTTYKSTITYTIVQGA